MAPEDTEPHERDRSLGRNLKRLREVAGKTQTKLAEDLSAMGHSIQQQTVLKIERGSRPLRARELVDVAALLNVSVEDLLADPDLAVTKARRSVEDYLRRAGGQMAVARSEQLTLARLVAARRDQGEAVRDDDVRLSELSVEELWLVAAGDLGGSLNGPISPDLESLATLLQGPANG